MAMMPGKKPPARKSGRVVGRPVVGNKPYPAKPPKGGGRVSIKPIRAVPPKGRIPAKPPKGGPRLPIKPVRGGAITGTLKPGPKVPPKTPMRKPRNPNLRGR